jgi:signal transduction histidine kinase
MLPSSHDGAGGKGPLEACPHAPRRGPRVQTRISLLLIATAAAFVGFFLVVHSSQSRQLEQLFRDRSEQVRHSMMRVIELRANGARVHADDYTRWDEFVAFTRKPDPEWGNVNLTESIHTFGLDVAWVLDDRGRLLFTANPGTDPRLAPLPVPADELTHALLARPIRHFFAWTGAGLLEVWSSSIQGSDDFERKAKASGYYVIGRLWTPQHVASLGHDAGGIARIVKAKGGARDQSFIETGRIVLDEPLLDLTASSIALMHFEATAQMVPHVRRAMRASLLLMIAAMLVTLVAVWIALARWVGSPLATIGDALRREEPVLLRSSAGRRDEIGELARLVGAFFEQRKRLIEAREAAEAAALAKSQFLANISHELRTPMHGILSYSRFGIREAGVAEPAELRENFVQIEECGTSLLGLLNDLLDLAKLDAGRMKFDFGEVSLEDLANDVADEFASLYDERGLSIEILGDPALGPVCADRGRMTQVMRNLLSNAAKFTPEGGRVTVRVEARGALARVAVEDSGTGIPDGELELVFDKFEQSSRTSPRSGTGLGLAICREIVEAHEGTIRAENRTEGGARLIFEISIGGPASAREPFGEASTRVAA